MMPAVNTDHVTTSTTPHNNEGLDGQRMYGGYGRGYGWGSRLVRLGARGIFFNIFCLYSTDFLLQADYVTGTETTRPPTNYDRAQDVSADTSPFIGMFFLYSFFFFYKQILLFNNYSYYNYLNNHNHNHNHHPYHIKEWPPRPSPIPCHSQATSTCVPFLPGRRVTTSAVAMVTGTAGTYGRLQQGEWSQTTCFTSFVRLVSFLFFIIRVFYIY